MPTTNTLHSTTCPSAVAMGAATVLASAYTTARKHKCIYNVATPASVKVTSTTQTVPPVSAKK